jgi:LmbE family N-acetylglucosaminyl deacetylase
MKKMLLVFAHPDDESFTCGSLIPKYVKAGWQVDLVCATRGEVGTSGPYTDVTPEQLGEIRQKELEKAGTHLGIHSITYLGYMDGSLHSEEPGELEEKIYQKMEELVPDCVITFDTTGLTNHPDHIRICFAATYAFQKYAFFIEEHLKGTPGYEEENAPKLYYVCAPEGVVSYLQKNKVLPKESYGRPWIGTADKFVSVVISTKGFEKKKKEALKMHKTQEEEVQRFLSFARNPLMKQEYFIWRMHGTREVFMGNNDRVASEL